jgi:hypothetical protein
LFTAQNEGDCSVQKVRCQDCRTKGWQDLPNKGGKDCREEGCPQAVRCVAARRCELGWQTLSPAPNPFVTRSSRASATSHGDIIPRVIQAVMALEGPSLAGPSPSYPPSIIWFPSWASVFGSLLSPPTHDPLNFLFPQVKAAFGSPTPTALPGWMDPSPVTAASTLLVSPSPPSTSSSMYVHVPTHARVYLS